MKREIKENYFYEVKDKIILIFHVKNPQCTNNLDSYQETE